MQAQGSKGKKKEEEKWKNAKQCDAMSYQLNMTLEAIERWQVAQQTYSLGMGVFSRVACKDELSTRAKNKTKPGN